MAALRCGHPLSVNNLEPEGRYFRCKTCRRAKQNSRYRARRVSSQALAAQITG